MSEIETEPKNKKTAPKKIETDSGVDPCHCYKCGANQNLTMAPVRVDGDKAIVGFLYLCPHDTGLYLQGKLDLTRKQ